MSEADELFDAWRQACGEAASQASAAASAAATAAAEVATIVGYAAGTDQVAHKLGELTSLLADLERRAGLARAAVDLPGAPPELERTIALPALGAQRPAEGAAGAQETAAWVGVQAAAAATFAADLAKKVASRLAGDGGELPDGCLAARAVAAAVAALSAAPAVRAAVAAGQRAVTFRPENLHVPTTVPASQEIEEDSTRAAAHVVDGSQRVQGAVLVLRERSRRLAEAGAVARRAAEGAESAARAVPFEAKAALSATNAALAACHQVLAGAKDALSAGCRVAHEVGTAVSDAGECAAAAALAAVAAAGLGRLDRWMERRRIRSCQAGVVAPEVDLVAA